MSCDGAALFPHGLGYPGVVPRPAARQTRSWHLPAAQDCSESALAAMPARTIFGYGCRVGAFKALCSLSGQVQWHYH